MHIILKNISNGKEAIIDGVAYKYLYPIFFVLNYQFNLELDDNKSIVFSDEVVHVLHERLGEQLSFLLDTCYQKPTESEIQERPSWYEKFVYKGDTYIVNYTTSGIGRLFFTINSRLKFIKEIIDSKSHLSFTTIDL